MLLVFDVGNTVTTAGLFDGTRLAGTFRVGTAGGRTADELVLLLRQAFPGAVVRAAAIASVEPSATPAVAEAAARITGREPLLVTAGLETGLEIDYLDPLALGADRLANVVAAFRLHGAPAIVVDLGTATKFEVIVRERRYRGGAIAPGVRTAAAELLRRGARLGAFELRTPGRAVGRNTEECLQSGVLLGAAGMVDSMVRRLAAEERIRPVAVATGGLAGLIAPLSQTIEKVDPELTLQGIRILHELNAPAGAAVGTAGRAPRRPRKALSRRK
jgi:type III pantothenate kinase